MIFVFVPCQENILCSFIIDIDKDLFLMTLVLIVESLILFEISRFALRKEAKALQANQDMMQSLSVCSVCQ